MKLSDWARKEGIQYGTALKWFHAGILPIPSYQLPTGTIIVNVEEKSSEKLKNVVYARVSSANKKQDLENQLKLVCQFCAQKGWIVDKEVKEIASGMNDNRPKLNKILDQKNVRLIVLYKDRLTRFGFNFVKKSIENNQGEVVVINQDKIEEDDLLKDFIAIITSFCCRLYGARRGQSKALSMKSTLVSTE